MKPKPDDEKRGHRPPRDAVAADKRITIRLSPREETLISKAAARAKKPIGAWIRDVAIERATAATKGKRQ